VARDRTLGIALTSSPDAFVQAARTRGATTSSDTVSTLRSSLPSAKSLERYVDGGGTDRREVDPPSSR